MSIRYPMIRAVGMLTPVALAVSLATQPVWSDDDSRERRSRAESSTHAASALTIDRARWRADRRRLEVDGNGDDERRVTITNAFDASQVIGSDRVDGDDWRISARRVSPVPCRVRATQSDGQVVEADVANAPSNCAPAGPVEPPTPQPTVAINDVTAAEDAGSLTFTVSLSAASTQSVSVQYATRDASATAGEDGDYLEANGTLVFPAGATTRTVSITLVDDGSEESDETFSIQLSSATNAGLGDDLGIGTIVDNDAANPPPPPPPPVAGVSINSTSRNVADAGADPYLVGPVPEEDILGNATHKVLAINDLGMHCGDLDTRVASILPPFQVLLAQVIERGGEPRILGRNEVEVRYSAASNPNDPILGDPTAFRGVTPDGEVYKTNFWDVASQAYDPFYPQGILGALPVDTGLPVPNVEELYIGPDGLVASGDEDLVATQHAMPGQTAAYIDNVPQTAHEFYRDKPFFVNFPFGYVAENLDWFEGSGVPLAAFDDFGRENPYPVVRVQAIVGNDTVATTDTVLPISGEASCKSCHSADVDVSPETPHAGSALVDLANVADQMDDPAIGNVPVGVSIEYATDINILRLHDQKHGTDLENQTPVVCQSCHYTPALDLAHLGPLGPENDAPLVLNGVQVSPSLANGRDQLKHSTMSNVMHGHHGSTGLFPDIPAPVQAADGTITNQAERLAALEQNCYQCHPGKNTQCLRGAMFNGGMLCSDCHGSLAQVGDDFSRNVSPDNVGAFELDGNFYTDPHQPRVPWANEPGCGSCHTGDANSNLAAAADTVANTADSNGVSDGIRLRMAYRIGDVKATPIVPGNKRFAEPVVAASFNGTANKGAGNPQLYRVSTGHGGVMCEGCHGATHAEWPNANPNANDNLTAKQLQGHTGTVSECSTCHVTSELRSDTQGGPHGMHLVNDSRFWREAHKDMAKRENSRAGGGTCGACHGSDHRGTVLSRTPVDRTFRVEGRDRIVLAGEPVGCDVCHSLSKSFDD